MKLIGLPGEAALVFLSSITLNIYSAIAVIDTLPLSAREVVILAIMCLTAHNMIVETAVMKKTSSSAIKMIVLRIGAALVAAWLFNLVLPHGEAVRAAVDRVQERIPLWPVLQSWGFSTLKLLLKIVVLVFSIMIIQRLMEEFKVTVFLSKLFAPVMKLFGLSPDASFLWIVINVVGYAYGATLIIEKVKGGQMKPQEADLFNHHASMSHSLFEDTILFMALGVPIFWLTVPRLAMALVVVWFERMRRHYFRRSFKVGTA
jgi:hypothetical protein